MQLPRIVPLFRSASPVESFGSVNRTYLALSFVLFIAQVALASPSKLPQAAPEAAGMSSTHLEMINAAVAEALEDGQMAGCVVLIGRNGKVVFERAYGHRQVEPEPVPMTVDTVFDMASLTKPIATATSIMALVERGKIRLRNDVEDYVPDFGQNGKGDITIFHLLTHQGGLIPDNALKDYDDGPETAMKRIYTLDLRAEPGERFIYTDVGFIMLADVIRHVTGQNVHEFSQANVFQPLGMTETGYLPREELQQRAAVTEKRNGEWMRGEVHDPRAYRLGGIAGHAGLFSTARDLAVYAQMMLNGGEYAGVRILGPRTVAQMTRAFPVSSGERALGWDVRTGYSSNRGEFLSPRAFGHGGFTGTSLWIDPELDLFVIFLSNRLHPDGRGSVNSLAGTIGTIAAAAIDQQSPQADHRPPGAIAQRMASSPYRGNVLTGIDVLQRENFARLRGQRIGLITNHTGINRDGVSTVSLLFEAPDVNLVALFSPEHGLEGKLDVSKISDTRDERTGLIVHSLYGATRKPTAESLEGIDTLVFDIQDIGARFYTYPSTMGNAMRAAAEHGKKFVVLDRPNPINGVDVDGPVLDAGRESFVGYHQIPVRHGMTIGELARMFNAELKIGVDLEIVPVENWRREDYFDATGLLWINPSPNMRNLNEALLYPGIGLLETTNLSVGRGTDTPFEVIGAPWLDGRRLADSLNRARLPGVTFVPLNFTPDSSKFANERCGGINILITDRQTFDPLRTGFAIAHQLRMQHPEEWESKGYARLLNDAATLEAIQNGQSVRTIQAGYQTELEEFRKRRDKFLIYRR